ncbi:hypothetical protein DICVIV_08705 [Dictyocaulus viviparus]|uniref:Glycosyltransferase family 92 protein n=1 Tax=Dictyocaulus viviparus TaxID=29172 RepID=A0A0D8XSB2_DICVI|nr:hypothetical protein DICVIV_08705 [Dictyocaulus viviparus]
MQLQDCVFRTRERSTWVATVDLDERIYVIEDTTISQFIRSSAKRNYGELRFRCRWVLRYHEIPNDAKTWRLDGSYIPMAKWHNTSQVAPVNHTTKSIIQPIQVESMGVHQVLRFLPGAHVHLVPPEQAVIRQDTNFISLQILGKNCFYRHYRIIEGWTNFLKEAETFGSFEYTEVASNKLQALNDSVTRKISQIFNI